MGHVSPNGSKIDFLRGPYFCISCMIFRYYPEIQFTSTFEIEIHERKSLTSKKSYFLTRGRQAASILMQSSFNSFFHQHPDLQFPSYLL